MNPRRHNRLTLPLLFLSASLLSAHAVAEPKADALVAKADAIRFPTEPFQVLVTVYTRDRDGDTGKHVYQVLQKGHENSVVRTLEPESERGQVMLLRGADLWVFLPDVSQPVRLPLSQRLTGQVANGDLARANFAGDYAAVLDDIQEIDGEKYAVLELTAARKGVTYHRVRYWVNATNHRPYRAEFYTRSNRLMKVGDYSEFKTLGGGIRPTRLHLRDALRTGEESLVVYSNLKLRDIPDKFFTKDFLQKLQE
jgi:outer membrane lipoprotein-sorting protein